MTINQVVNYVLYSPNNINTAILKQMLLELIESSKPSIQDENTSIMGYGVIGNIIFGE